MFEVHPFNRPFDDSGAEIKLVKDYDNMAGNHWRVMDIVNALVAQDFEVPHMEEFHAEPDRTICGFTKRLMKRKQTGTGNSI
jgi:hypothetical protein